ncbi:FHA domain-containing protein (plasmid) [Rhodococcus sp. JS3073]|nr:FHA domain-containing protein [Rhodococcus sp. JS3073]
MTVGRSHRSDLVLSWDPMVSRLHAVIEWTGTHWGLPVDAGRCCPGLLSVPADLDGDRVEKVFLPMIVIQGDADATGAMSVALPFSGIAHRFTRAVREWGTCSGPPLLDSPPGLIGYVFIVIDVINDIAALFEAVASQCTTTVTGRYAS